MLRSEPIPPRFGALGDRNTGFMGGAGASFNGKVEIREPREDLAAVAHVVSGEVGFAIRPCRKLFRQDVVDAGRIARKLAGATKPPPNVFNRADQAIDAAVEAGAEDHSPVELRFAREKLAQAHSDMDRKHYDKALYLIDQSEVNSELAIEKTKTAIIRGKVTELARQNEILQEDIEATFGGGFE